MSDTTTLPTVTSFDDLRALPVGTVFDYRPYIGGRRYWDYVVEADGIRERSHGTTERGNFYSWDRIRNGLFTEYDKVKVDAPAEEIPNPFDATLPEETAPAPEVVDPKDAEIERLKAQVARLGAEITDPNDYRVRNIWRKAAEVADDEGFCSEYDRLAEAMGVPSRNEFFTTEYEFTVEVEITRTVTLTMTGTGPDEEDAWEALSGEVGTELDDLEIEHDSWDVNSYRAVNETRVPTD